ncbi:FKBP-type peptidyl-prolyl cis-trans isomerase [Leadbettera azotonutricia]|uniref:Peptidyl-prolyl cis-trans isomerase n=1 Tax=Leadbettera azotonutricia (strain ATCC BAA-888 / DSM 13862 / ZAS-9) TaxID=545695 RepID=F5Y7H9_LEAAZ|nr:FKBP-type peptidyl-prolyl cis-trans isomerase [Leadbettera azotonutricia]AEF80661.1 outer membrane protein MIP (Macrophage infectivitypotentiator) (Peptidyl-prolyl cis-trans isomerase) (PPIase) (Rotamase) [Leadbettera azotonutricia ZAS-9]
MKTNKYAALFLSFFAFLVLLGGCKKEASAQENVLKIDKDTSYAIGMYLASQFTLPNVSYEYKSFSEGFKATTEKEEPKFSLDEGISKIQAVIEQISARDETGAQDEVVKIDVDTSYAIGMYLASQFTIPDVTYNYPSFSEGFKAFVEAKETKFSMDDAIPKIQAVFDQVTAREEVKNQELGAKNLDEGLAFLAENGTKPGIVTTSTGLQYEVITEGSGAKPTAQDEVRVDYEGTLLDGTVFDSSYARGEPIEFPLNGVIPGWTEGLQLMAEGSTYRLFIPSDLAYGSQGGGPIPPNSTLIFKVELLAVVK